MKRYGYILLLGGLLLLTGHSSGINPVAVPQAIQAPATMDHSTFTQVLETFVDADGNVDYTRLKAEPDSLLHYLGDLAATSPDAFSEAAQIAFWINAYNAYTLKLIIDKYPVSSILRTVGIPIPKINMPWMKKIATVGGTVYTLDHIEHQILRKDYTEPRIHFAIVCASISCPQLRREAYFGEKLEAQLQDQTLQFLNDPTKNQINGGTDTIHLSKIFDWFKEDFLGNAETVQPYLAQFFDGEIKTKLSNNEYRIKYTDYDWGLNEQK